MAHVTQPQEVRAPAVIGLSLTFWWFLLGALVLMSVLLGFGAPPWMFGSAAAVLFLLGVALVGTHDRVTDQAAAEDFPDAATPEEQRAALDHLAGLPQFRRLADDSLFDYLRGCAVSPCACGQYSGFHLVLRYSRGHRHGIALVTRSALEQYVAVQSAVAGALRPWLPESGILRPHPVQEGGDA